MGRRNFEYQSIIAICIILILVLFIGIYFYYKINSNDDNSKTNSPNPSQQQNSPLEHKTKIDIGQESDNIDHKTPLLGKPAIVLFYSDTCGPSNAMLPEWEIFKNNNSDNDKFDIITLEVKTAREDFNREDIKGVPTIRFYKDGYPSSQYIQFNESRNNLNFEKFVKLNL